MTTKLLLNFLATKLLLKYFFKYFPQIPYFCKKNLLKKMSKKPKKPIIKEAFGKNYIVKNGRKLPIYKCLISEEAGLVTMILIRRLPNGNFAFGSYMVDTYCLGLKSTTFKIDLSMDGLEDLLEEFSYGVGTMQECTYATIHNWVYGGIAYAEDLGFKPDSDFNMTKFFLEEDTEDVELIEFEFGMDGRPHYFSGPYDNVQKILDTLKKNVGEDNFDFTDLG